MLKLKKIPKDKPRSSRRLKIEAIAHKLEKEALHFIVSNIVRRQVIDDKLLPVGVRDAIELVILVD